MLGRVNQHEMLKGVRSCKSWGRSEKKRKRSWGKSSTSSKKSSSDVTTSCSSSRRAASNHDDECGTKLRVRKKSWKLKMFLLLFPSYSADLTLQTKLHRVLQKHRRYQRKILFISKTHRPATFNFNVESSSSACCCECRQQGKRKEKYFHENSNRSAESEPAQRRYRVNKWTILPDDLEKSAFVVKISLPCSCCSQLLFLIDGCSFFSLFILWFI